MSYLPTPTTMTARYDVLHSSIVWCLTFPGTEKAFEVWGMGMTLDQHNEVMIELAEIREASKPVSHIAQMRAADQAHAAKNAEKLANGEMKGLPRIRPALATSAGRADAAGTATLLLRGTENILDRNNMRRDHSLPRRALSMASSRGRVTPDNLASVMAFFSNPGDMAETLLASFLPAKVALADAKRIVTEKADAEGWGPAATASLLSDLPTILRTLNPATGHAGRAPSRVLICDGVTPPSVPTGKRGRPSGPKYVAFLPPIDERPFATCEDISGIPGGNDVAHGTGQGYGCEVWADGRYGWSGRFSTPAQVNRRNADLDAYHLAEAKAYAERLAAEQAE